MRKTLAAVLLALSISAPALAAPCGPIPALPDTVRRTEYTGIVAQTGPFPITFQLYGDGTDYQNWISVWVNGTLKVGTVDYTVAPASGPAFGTACLPITNAQVTFLAPQTGTIEIEGARRPRRASQVSENAGVSAHTFNQVISDLTATLRERWDREPRLLRAPPAETLAVLPPAASRANGFLQFDATGLIPQIAAAGPGTGTVTGPPTSTPGNMVLWNSSNGVAISDAGFNFPSNPQIHPSSGNLICSQGHFPWFVDQSLCSTADIIAFTSKDPSALFTGTVGGTITNADTIKLVFTFGSGTCVAGADPACAAIATLTGADTTTTAAAKLVTAIKANANLFTSPNGGYAGGKPIAYVVNSGALLAFDFDATVPLKIVATISGSATETFTFGNTSCGTACSHPLDNNPSFETSRLTTDGNGTPIAPPANSVISNWQVSSSNSSAPGTLLTTYGQFNWYVENSTSGAVAAHGCISTVNGDNSLGCRIYVGRGLYTTSANDNGVDSITAAGPITSNSTGAGNPTAATGPSMTMTGGASPSRFCFNWTTAAYIQCSELALSWDFKPSNSSSSGWTLSANLLQPDSDNATNLGGASNRIASLFAKNHVGTTTNDNAAAGSVGEFVSSNIPIGSEVSLTTATPANITSISLTAGDWDVYGNVSYDPAGTTTMSGLFCWTSTTTAAFPTRPNNGALSEMTLTFTAGQPQTLNCGSQRLSLSGTTTVFLSTTANFATSTLKGYGFIGARRRR